VQELVEQIAVGGMHFDEVKTGRLGVACGLHKVLHNAGDLGRLQRAAPHRALGAQHIHFAFGGNGAGGHGQLAIQQLGVEIRPTCHSCSAILPPSACTASVTCFQPATCASDQMPGVLG
jgi:hypothetical protein